MERKLAVILAADVAGYSRLMAEDEEATLATLAAYRETISGIVREHSGRIFGTAGDSVIAEFTSAVQCVRAAVAIQRALHRRNADLPPGRRMEFRIGINLGDVMAEGDDLLGDGVNVAARLQAAALPAGICISGAVRDQIEAKLTFPVTPLGKRTLKNLPRPVTVFAVDWKLDDPGASGILGETLALPDKPSIAVLPFDNMSGDVEQDYFADGITEDIITALSRYRWFFVIARNSSFAYKGKAIDVKQVAGELGVRYLLEGSVRKASSRLRITAQLVEAESGTHLWAERYDRDAADVFTIQDEITESVVGAIEPEILMGEGRRAARKNPENLDALDCCLRGMWHHYQFSEEETREAENLLRRSIALDPKLSRGHMGLARVLFGRCWWGWSDDIQRDLAASREAAAAALSLDDRDPYSHYIFAFNCMAQQEHVMALSGAQRAIDLSPNFALGQLGLGWIRNFIGHFNEALDPLLRCLRLSPHDPMTFEFLSHIALAHYHLGNYDEAAHFGERARHSRPMYVSLRTFAASLGQLDRLDEASAVLDEMRQFPLADPARHWELTTCYADPTHREHLVDGLKKAGWSDSGAAA